MDNLTANENAVDVKILERYFKEKIDMEVSNIVDTVEDRIQNAVLTAIDSIVAPKTEWAIRLTNASTGQDARIFTASSEREEQIGITAPLEDVSEKSNTLHVLNVNEETRNKIPDEASELSVPDAHFDWKPHTHSSQIGWRINFYNTLHQT